MSLVNRKILVIDDTHSIRTFLRICLQAHGALFHEAATAGQGLEICKRVHPDLVVLDLGLPDRDGLDILEEMKAVTGETGLPAIVVLTVRKEQYTREKALSLGADAYMTKPFLVEDLLEVIIEKLGAAE